MLVFLSYKWEDHSYADGMKGLLNNPNNDYRHLTERERKDLRTQGEEIWKSYIRDMIVDCDGLICLIGQDTHNATGVIYELEEATSLGKKIIPVRIPRTSGGLPRVIRHLTLVSWNAREINDELSKT